MAFSFSGARTVFDTHLAAAGTTISPAIRNVDRGAATSVTEPMIRSWYTGDGDSELFPETLTDASGVERVAFGLYWPITDAATAKHFDTVARAWVASIRNRVKADGDLGGNVSEVTVGDFAVEYLETMGGWIGYVLGTADFHFIDVDTLAD